MKRKLLTKNPSNVLKEKSCQVLVIFTYRGSSVSVFCVRTGFSCVNYTIQPFCRNKHSCITESIILKAPYTSLLEACKKPTREIFHLIATDIFIYMLWKSWMTFGTKNLYCKQWFIMSFCWRRKATIRLWKWYEFSFPHL